MNKWDIEAYEALLLCYQIGIDICISKTDIDIYT